jgi:hypothetical protein
MVVNMAPGWIQIILALLVVAVPVFCFWKIYRKAGFSGWLSLLMLIPLVNLIALVHLAVSDWPALKRSGSAEAFN